MVLADKRKFSWAPRISSPKELFRSQVCLFGFYRFQITVRSSEKYARIHLFFEYESQFIDFSSLGQNLNVQSIARTLRF